MNRRHGLFWKAEVEKIETFEMWLKARLAKVKWMDDEANEVVLAKISWIDYEVNWVVLQLLQAERSKVNTRKKRQMNWIGNTLCRKLSLRTMLKGRIEGK